MSKGSLLAEHTFEGHKVILKFSEGSDRALVDLGKFPISTETETTETRDPAAKINFPTMDTGIAPTEHRQYHSAPDDAQQLQWAAPNAAPAAINGACRPSPIEEPSDNGQHHSHHGAMAPVTGVKRAADDINAGGMSTGGGGSASITELGAMHSPFAPKSRKVHTPGATQAALARLAALKASETSHEPARSASPPLTARPNKVVTPGATQAAIARLANLGAGAAAPERKSSLGAAASIASSKKKGTASGFKTTATATPITATPPSMGAASGSRKIAAPGATQAAMARLAAYNNTSNGAPATSVPYYHQAAVAPQQQQQQHYPSAPATAINNNNPAVAHLLAPSGTFEPGSNVWAKMQSYPWWPAQVQIPSPEHARLRHDPINDIFVVFYGTADYTWIPKSDVCHFAAGSPSYTKYASTKNKGLQKAIDEAWVHLGRARPDVLGKPRAV